MTPMQPIHEHQYLGWLPPYVPAEPYGVTSINRIATRALQPIIAAALARCEPCLEHWADLLAAQPHRGLTHYLSRIALDYLTRQHANELLLGDSPTPMGELCRISQTGNITEYGLFVSALAPPGMHAVIRDSLDVVAFAIMRDDQLHWLIHAHQ